MSTPTQVVRPWRATLRTIFQALLAFAVILPLIVQASGLDPTSVPGLAVALAVAAGITRVMAVPQVEVFLARFVPFLAADPPARNERGQASLTTFLVIVAGVVVAWVVIQLLQLLIR